MITLIDHNGELYAPNADIYDDLMRQWYDGRHALLIYEYPDGDHDTISWPDYKPEHLRSALYDAREQGIIPDVNEVQLPDGTVFTIEYTKSAS